MSTSVPLVSAVILNYASGKSAVGCVRALQQQTLASQMEFIVIDNHSEDDSIGILRTNLASEKNVNIVETSKNKGFGSGYNTGIRYACGTYLLINNPDKRLESTGLERMVAAMENDPTIGILGPKLVHPDGERRLSMRRDPHIIDIVSRRSILGRCFPDAVRRYLMLDADPSAMQEVDWVVGGCFLMRHDLFQELGGFDEKFFLFFEDADLCRRCRQAGKRVVYFPQATALDRPRRLSGESWWDLLSTSVGRSHLRSAVRYFRKWTRAAA